MAVELQKLGSTISVSTGLNNMTFNVQCLKKNIDKTMELLEERMLNPNFTAESFDRIQKQTIESFKRMKSVPAMIATAVYDKLNAGYDNIWGLSQSGTEYTIGNLKLKDVQDYYNNYMTSQDTKVVVVGDITQAEIEPKLTFLNKLPNKKINLLKSGNPPAVEKTKIYLVDVPKAAQTEFRVGYVTGMKFDPTGEWFKSNVMNYVLGGSFNSRLNMNLREDKGWTYGARSVFSSDEYSGNYTFSAGIRADATDSALIETMKDIRNYASGGITADELAFTKNAIGQSDALRYETGFQKAAFIGRMLTYNLPGNYVEKQNKLLAGITKAEIDGLAKKWLVADKMNILLVGDKVKILPGLQKLGYDIIELDVDGNKKDAHIK